MLVVWLVGCVQTEEVEEMIRFSCVGCVGWLVVVGCVVVGLC